MSVAESNNATEATAQPQNETGNNVGSSSTGLLNQGTPEVPSASMPTITSETAWIKLTYGNKRKAVHIEDMVKNVVTGG